MKKFNNINIMHGLKNDIVLTLPELLERILDELENINKRLIKLEKKKLSKNKRV